MIENLKQLIIETEKLGMNKERVRIGEAFYKYSKREWLPVDIQKDIIRIIVNEDNP